MAGALGAAWLAGTGVAVGWAVAWAVATGAAPATSVYVALTTTPLVAPVAVTPYWPGARLAGIVNVQVTSPVVSAVSVATVGPLKLSVADSPARKPVPVTVSCVPGAACAGLKLRVAAPWLIVNVVDAESPTPRPLASTPYWPGAMLGTLNARLHVPWPFTVGDPTA